MMLSLGLKCRVLFCRIVNILISFYPRSLSPLRRLQRDLERRCRYVGGRGVVMMTCVTPVTIVSCLMMSKVCGRKRDW